MQLTKNILALVALLPLSLAAPAPEPAELEAKLIPNANLLGTTFVTMWSGDVCNGGNDQATVTNGGYRCIPVSNKRSISVSGNCRVITWSGTDCRGSSFVTGQGCFSVLYGSVSIQC